MRTRTIIIALTLMLVGCGQHKEEIIRHTAQGLILSDQLCTLEGCQYIVVGFGPQRWGSHKGNCNNPIHNK